MVTAKLATWQSLFERVQAHKRLLNEALGRHARGEAPYPSELASELARMERDAMRALSEAAQAVEAHHAAERPAPLPDQPPDARA